MKHRLLITGTRNGWPGFNLALKLRLAAHGLTCYDIIELVHGDARGVDAQADEWARLRSVPVHPMPCDWNGGETGGQRNQRMVDRCVWLGDPWLCVAFPGPKSRGTWDCVRRVQAVSGVVEVISQAKE